MTTANQKLDAILRDNRVIPVLTIANVADAVPLARALVAGGIRALEITLRTAAAKDAIGRIAAEVPDAIVGVGTIRSARDVEFAVKAGARFAVSPGTNAAIFDAVAAARLPFLPGVATASEVLTALDRGHETLKFFPATIAGGLPAIKALRGPFPEAKFCPTGGISEATAREWLDTPGIVAVGGSWLAPEASIAAKDWAAITAIARRTLERIT